MKGNIGYQKYVSLDNNLDTLSKVVVIDALNQNQGVLKKEMQNGFWSPMD